MQTSKVVNQCCSIDGEVDAHVKINDIAKKISAEDGRALQTATHQLFNEKLLALEIMDFATVDECDELVETVLKYPVDSSYLGGNANKILVSQHNKMDDQDGYFEAANNHPLINEPSFERAIAKIFELLKKSGLEVSVARDESRGLNYCPAIIREFYLMLYLHNDLGKREGFGWDPIGRITKQWAFVLKISQCEGGETRWYPKHWELKDEIYFNLRKDSYSYEEDVVKGCDEFIFRGDIGTLILFDCTCYHAVQPVIAGNRYTLGGFIGLLEPENKLVVWS